MSYEKALANFGKKVKATRKALNLTQKDLAQRAGITVRCLYSIEHPDKVINKSVLLSTVIKIASALNVSIPDLLTYDEDKNNNTNTKEKLGLYLLQKTAACINIY